MKSLIGISVRENEFFIDSALNLNLRGRLLKLLFTHGVAKTSLVVGIVLLEVRLEDLEPKLMLGSGVVLLVEVQLELGKLDFVVLELRGSEGQAQGGEGKQNNLHGAGLPDD